MSSCRGVVWNSAERGKWQRGCLQGNDPLPIVIMVFVMLKKGLRDMTHHINSIPGACWELSWPIFMFRSFVMTRVNKKKKKCFTWHVMHKNNNKLYGSSHGSFEVHFRVLIFHTSIPFFFWIAILYFKEKRNFALKKSSTVKIYWAHGRYSSVTHKHNPRPLIN